MSYRFETTYLMTKTIFLWKLAKSKLVYVSNKAQKAVLYIVNK